MIPMVALLIWFIKCGSMVSCQLRNQCINSDYDIFKINSIFLIWDNSISLSSVCIVASTLSVLWVLWPLFPIEYGRWKYILEIFFCNYFWKQPWPVYMGCVSSCCLSSMSCYWMSQCHSVLFLSTYSCFRTIFNRKELFFSLFKVNWVSFVCRDIKCRSPFVNREGR